MSKINLNSNPYYDDYAAEKGFHQILFKPGYSVQARELTQLQTILRNQFSRIGNHIFTQGSMVIPGNTNYDLNICYVKLVDTSYNLDLLVGKEVVSATTGLTGLIRAVKKKTASTPDTLYVSYKNTGTGGEKVFPDDVDLSVDGVATVFRTAAAFAIGAASMAFINEGVFYANETFVRVEKQSIVIGDYTATPSCHVLLQIIESIITSDDDSTLLDPAQGSYNYAAPGADRLRIDLKLVTLPLGSAITEDYIEIMRFNEGVLEMQARNPKYNELEKSLARRTMDESGDYVVSGLKLSVNEHLLDGTNQGIYSAPTGDKDKLVLTTSPGKAYVNGFECENISPYHYTIDKARTPAHIKLGSFNLKPSYGQFFYATALNTFPSVKNRTVVTLRDLPGGSIIGSATLLAIDFHESNTNDSNAIYKIFVSDVDMMSGHGVEDVGEMFYGGVSIARVVQKLNILTTNNIDFAIGEEVHADTHCCEVVKFSRLLGELYTTTRCLAHDTPVIGDNINGMTSGALAKVIGKETIGKNNSSHLLFGLPYSSVNRVKNETDSSDLTYKIYYETLVTVVGGTASFSVSGMTIDPKELGNFLMITSSGPQPLSCANVATDGLSVSFSGITPNSGSMRVVCAATKSGASQASPKTKIFVAGYQETALTINSGIVQLKQADVIRINSITSSVNTEGQAGDVTDFFNLDNGQTDYYYGRGRLLLKSNKTAPTGTLTVNYDYFNHGSGDYLCIDSYEFSGVGNYYELQCLTYNSKNTGISFNLRNNLDFRPRVGEDGTFTGVGASLSNLAQIDSRIGGSLKYYIGRVDKVILNKNGAIGCITGTPDDNPAAGKTPAGAISIAEVFVPPYTFKATDCRQKRTAQRRYTMSDIGIIDSRLSSLEEYITLTQTETDTINYDIVDATTGLSRFKSGYLVETFDNADKIADTANEKFKVAYVSRKIRPMFELIEADLNLHPDTNETTIQVKEVAMLPYTEKILAQQPVSSKITNVNPFAVFSWVGNMIIDKSSDSWTDTVSLPDIINKEVDVRDEWVVVERPAPPIVIPSPVINVTNVTNTTNNISNIVNNNTTNVTNVTNITTPPAPPFVPPPPVTPVSPPVSPVPPASTGGWVPVEPAVPPATPWVDYSVSGTGRPSLGGFTRESGVFAQNRDGQIEVNRPNVGGFTRESGIIAQNRDGQIGEPVVPAPRGFTRENGLINPWDMI